MRYLTAFAMALAALFAAPALAQDSTGDPIADAVAAIGNFDSDGAVALLDSACKTGNSEACWRLALTQAQTGKDAEADKQFLANCAGKDARSCYMLARRIPSDGPAKDQARARTALGKACDGGLAYACVELAQTLRYDDSLKTPPATIARIYEQACAAGSRDGCHGAAEIYGQTYENPDMNLTKALALDIRGCELGLAEACSAVPGIEAGAAEEGSSPTVAMQQRWQTFRQRACTLGELGQCQEFLSYQYDLPVTP